jgi:acyl-CoA synthetase (AMP-forming)/AMP-acid ligase II
MIEPLLLPSALIHVAASRPSHGVGIFDRGGRKCDRRTFPELLAMVRDFAGRWQMHGVAAGDRVILSLDTSWTWIGAWLGAVWLGALPVAAAPPGPLSSVERYRLRLDAVMRKLDARYVLVPVGSLAAELTASSQEPLTGTVIAADRFMSLTPVRPPPNRPADDDIVSLQLTSGSTGAPKAAMLSHRGFVHNAMALQEALVTDSAPNDASLAGWLPLHHDMGLVGYLISSIITGMNLWLFPPTAFLGRPNRWLEFVSNSGPCITFAPNFAYGHCARYCSAKDIRAMDLSQWRVAVVGAEMVRPETMDLFSTTFAASGFTPDVLRPGYGLAEATLAVCVDQKHCGVRTTTLPQNGGGYGGRRSVVCVGATVRDTKIRVIDGAGSTLPDGNIGEVVVSGPGVFRGYFNDTKATNEVLTNGWLRTGDLGLIRDHELYVTGRLKDVLIVHGQNFMPHEVEAIAEQAAGGGLSRSCAFSTSRDLEAEKVVLVVEVTTGDADTLAAHGNAIRRLIAGELSFSIGEVLLVRRGTIPKTSSGKLRRDALRDLYLKGILQPLLRT